MLRKIITKGMILNSLHFAYLQVPFPQSQFISSFYCFSTERPVQNNSKPLNHSKDKQSIVNTSSTKSSESSDHKSENDESKKKQKVSYRKVQKQKDRQIAYIIRQFRESIQEHQFTTSKFSRILKELADQYRQERHQQFLYLRQQLEKLTVYFDQVNFKYTKLQDLLNMLDFIRIVTRIQTFNKRVLEKSRNQVMEAVANYLDPLEKVQTNELMVIFCKISSTPFAGLYEIAINLHDRLVDMANSQQGLTFSVYQLFILMKSLSKKNYLSHVDKRIIQIVLVIMGSRMGEIDVNLKFQIVKTLLDMKIWANIADNRLLSIADQIFKEALAKLKKGNTLTQLQYISQCPVNDNQDHKEMVRIVFHRLVMQIESKASNFNPLRIICNCLKHISVDEITSSQKNIVMSYIVQLFQDAGANYRKELQNILLELLQFGFFDREVSQLNKLMAHPHFELYWTHIYEYSNQGLVFPTELVVKKIHSGVHTFKPEPTFLKVAYSVAIQTKLQSQNESIANLHKKIVKSLGEVDWQKVGLEWLTKIAILNPKLVRNFHQQYANIYQHRLKPSQQSLKQQYSRIRGEKLRQLDYWQYLFATTQFDHKLPTQILLKMPVTAITLPVSKQLGRISSFFDHKTLLLAAILSAFQTSKLSFKDSEANQVIQLLVHFKKGLGQGFQSFDQLYWLLCDRLVRSYTKIPKYQKPLNNFLLMLLLSIQRSAVRNSIHHRNFVSSLLSTDGIFTFENEYTHLKGAIARVALNKNMFSQQYLPRIDRSYLSAQEQNIIKAMIGEFKFEKVDQQSLKLLFRTVKPNAQTLKLLIASILQSIEQSNLQSLQCYLMFFSNKSSQNSDRILIKLLKQYIRNITVGETDFLGVIYNIKNLQQLENKLVDQLFYTISKQLVQKMSSISLADHLNFLKEINQRGLDLEDYQYKLLAYTFQHPYRGILAIDIAWQLCRYKLILNKEQFQILTNYATFNPDNYLKLLVLHQSMLTQADKLVANLANNQSKLVSDDLFLKYINQKYEQLLKKTKASDILFHCASEQPQKMLTLLIKEGIQVKSEEISDQNSYILNEKVMIAFTNIQGKNYNQVVQNILGFLYPKYELILCQQSPDTGELSQLLSRLRAILHLSESSVAKIKIEMALY